MLGQTKPSGPGTTPDRPAAERILVAAVEAYGRRGYAATSLDDLARDLGIRKQTILYYFPSRDALLTATIDFAAARLAEMILADAATSDRPSSSGHSQQSWGTVERVVRSVFRIAARRPAYLGLVRDVSRMGPPAATHLTLMFQPLIDAAVRYLETEMRIGRLKQHDPRLLLLSAYSMVVGVATEVEVLRAFGEEPTLASLIRRRDELLRLLGGALMP